MKRRCPFCGREAAWEENPWKPFCSERCQLADLGRWASEEYRVSLPESPEEMVAEYEREGLRDDETQHE